MARKVTLAADVLSLGLAGTMGIAQAENKTVSTNAYLGSSTILGKPLCFGDVASDKVRITNVGITRVLASAEEREQRVSL